MEYFWGFLILIGICTLTTTLSGLLGYIAMVSYAFLGFILGAESIIMGLGGLLGNILNYRNVSRYIKNGLAMSHAPTFSLAASTLFIWVFIVTTLLKYVFKIGMDDINYSNLLIYAAVVWFILRFLIKKKY